MCTNPGSDARKIIKKYLDAHPDIKDKETINNFKNNPFKEIEEIKTYRYVKGNKAENLEFKIKWIGE